MTATTLPPVRRTRMARPMTPVRITERHKSLRSGRLEAWAAVSLDGTWTYTRIEDAGTPWSVGHVPTRTDCGLFSSLPRARRATADGSALAFVQPPRPLPGPLEALRDDLAAMRVTAESPLTLDPEAEYLYAQERADYEQE